MAKSRTNPTSSNSSGRPSPLVCTKPSTNAGMSAGRFGGGFPVQVKQADKTGRPDIDKFEP